MILEINDEQVLILRDLLSEEVRYLEEEAIPLEESSDDEISKKDADNLRIALENTKNILNQILSMNWY